MISIDYIKQGYDEELLLDVGALTFDAGINLVTAKNGAGKTSLFKCILDLIPADSAIEIQGEHIKKTESWRSKVGVFLHEKYLMHHLTPKEYLELIIMLKEKDNIVLDVYLKQFEAVIDFDLNTKIINQLSDGQKNKVGIIAAMLNKPDVLILDEPFAKLDLLAKKFFWDLFKMYFLEQKNKCLLFSSHDLSMFDKADWGMLKPYLLQNKTLIKGQIFRGNEHDFV